MDDLVLFEFSDRIATITLNRTEKRNALNAEIISLLTEKFEIAIQNPQAKIIILKANGEAFSAGADLGYLLKIQKNSFEENIADGHLLKKLYSTIYCSPKLVIAQVEGAAIAGGCGLATVCDFVFATPESKFGYTETKIGFVPALVSVFLSRKVNEKIQKELLLTGSIIDAQKALEYNLINFVTNKTDINQNVKDFAAKLVLECSENSLKITKQLINNNNFNNLEALLNHAVEINAQVRATDDFKKGISAFLSKQKLEW